MDLIIKLLQTANSLSPLAVIGLLVTAIIMLVKNQKKVSKIETNDLHHVELSLEQISEVLQRIEVSLSYIKARINGRDTEN